MKPAANSTKGNANAFSAKRLIEELISLQSKAEMERNTKFFRDSEIANSKCLGVRWAKVFSLAKEYVGMPLPEIEKLLDSEYYEVRMAAVSIMDFQARDKKSTEQQRKNLFDLYLRKHDRINNWDLVDRSAPYVIGSYLFDKPRNLLYNLAKSKNVWERRTAIVSTYFFIRKGDASDTFKVAEILLNDPHDLIQKAVGSWMREAGKKNPEQLTFFLDRHAANMPRVMLRYAIEQMSKERRDQYLSK